MSRAPFGLELRTFSTFTLLLSTQSLLFRAFTVQELRLHNKERSRALARSGIEFTCEDEYDRSGIYSSHTHRTHVALQASFPKRPSVPGSAQQVASKEGSSRIKPPQRNTEATWLKRNVERLDIQDMPASGSAECPNYVAAQTPSPDEIKVLPWDRIVWIVCIGARDAAETAKINSQNVQSHCGWSALLQAQ